MSERSHIAEATRDNFEEQVVQRSQQVPVLVDFWASWCAPCHMLTPILEQLVDSYDGKVALVKVNADEQQELAASFGIRGLPTVKIFRHGDIVNEFVGVQPEPVIRQLLEPFLERQSDKLRWEAREAVSAGDLGRAQSLLEQARRDDPDNHVILIELAAIEVERGEFENAEATLQQLPINLQQSNEAEVIRARAHFGRAAASAEEDSALRKRIETDPDDLQARYRLAARRIYAEDFDAGLAQLLEIMRRDRKYEDDVGHRSMLAAFRLLGDSGELVERYRRQMAALLY